jgi:hypothetical protein
MKRWELGGLLTHEIGRGLDDAVIVCHHLVGLPFVVVALSAMSPTGGAVSASAS